MTIARNSTLTPHGIARVLIRGIRANFAPENQKPEIDRLIEYLDDLAMSRGTDGELPNSSPAASARAEHDAAWLEAIADAIDAVAN
jgi:hypothetical protein